MSGTAKVGSTLTVSNGTWSNSPTNYTYQWQRCSSTTSCTDIGNAVGQSYVVRNADGGYRIRADVTATNADGQSTAHSNLTSLVAATGAPVNTARPSVTGDAIVGQHADCRERHVEQCADFVPLSVGPVRPLRWRRAS